MVWACRHSCLPRPPTQAHNDIQEYTRIYKNITYVNNYTHKDACMQKT